MGCVGNGGLGRVDFFGGMVGVFFWGGFGCVEVSGGGVMIRQGGVFFGWHLRGCLTGA